jgi:hypothetical protein
LRILVERAGVGVGRRRVEVVIELLDVFAVVALVIGESEEAFLENGIRAVPERQGKAEATVAIAPAEKSVFSPAVGASGGMLAGKAAPHVGVGGVILPDGSPLAFGEIGSPELPVGSIIRVPLQSPGFRIGQ